MIGSDPEKWSLATVRRHEPAARGANVTINLVRRMEAEEVDSLRAALNLMGYVSAHSLTEPIRQVANNLGRFVHTIITADEPPELLATHAEATVAFDGFLNQVPLLRTRMLRNLALFAGAWMRDQVEASIQAEFDRGGAFRTMYELRNSCQHAMLPTDVVELRSSRQPDGKVVTRWDLLVGKWRALHTGFPSVLASLPDRMDFWQLVVDTVAFFDDRMRQCFLIAGEELDAAASRVLGLFGEAMRTAQPRQEIGVTIVQLAGRTGTTSITQQIPLNHIQCGEVLLNTDQARQQSGLPRIRPKPPGDQC